MEEQITVTVLASEVARGESVRGVLGELPGFRVAATVAGYHQGLQSVKESEPDVAMVIIDGELGAALAIVEEINRHAPATRVFALSRDDSPETIIKAMRAGATEFLTLPPDRTELVKALIKTTELRRLKRPTGPVEGELWVAHSPKEGVGVTTLVANLGVELIARGGRVVLVDLDFRSADLALFLNLTPAYSILDITLNFKRLDSVFLQGTLTRHPCGLYLLAAPAQNVAEPLDAPAEQVAGTLDLLRSMYEVVLVDTASQLDEASAKALAQADRIFLLTELTLPALRAHRRAVDELRDLGIGNERIMLIVAKHGRRGTVDLEEAKKVLQLEVAHILPRDDEAACTAVNKGAALADARPSSPLRQAVAALAEQLRPGAQDGSAPRRKRFQWIFARGGEG